MRFSALFPPPPPQPSADRKLAGTRPLVPPAAPAVPPPELPDDLDERVRLLGEWQLLEG